MSDRQNRYIAFEQFYKESKGLFEAYANSTRSERLGNLYSFYVRPGGRFGGVDKKIVEIFYGSRPFDSVTKIADGSQTIRKLERAHGASLKYQRTDDGQVLCSLIPASSENFRHPEDFILLDIVKNPAELRSKSKLHWRFFQAYMESTCLDGNPSLLQKLWVVYLRNFKECVVDQTLQKRRSTKFFIEIAKYTLTVGLSGFIILLITWFKDSTNSNQSTERHQEVLRIYSNLADSARSIAESTKKINERVEFSNQEASENLKLLNIAITESTSRIEKAITTLKEANETENGNAKKSGK